MTNRSKSRATTLLSLIAISLLATACNTVAGAGKDTQAAGRAVTNEANENR